MDEGGKVIVGFLVGAIIVVGGGVGGYVLRGVTGGASSTTNTTTAVVETVEATSFSSTEHTHSYVTKYNSEGHYQECETCGETTEVTPHTLFYRENVSLISLFETSSNDGTHHAQCTSCNYSFDEVHHYDEEHWATNGTSHWHICEECYCAETDSMATHRFTSFTDEGDHLHHLEECSICHYECDEDHDWDSGVVKKAATCMDSGMILYSCQDCTASEEVEITATGHNPSSNYESNDVYHWKTCLNSGCSEELEKDIHSFGNSIEIPEGENAGLVYKVCSKCGYETEPSEHDYDNGIVTKEATCTEDGEITYTCSECGATKTEVIPMYGHSYETSWTATEAGHYHICSRCKEREEEEIIPHEFEYKNDDATYHHQVCTECDYELGQEAHNWNEGVVTKEPDCTNTGVITYTCSTCGAEKTDTIPANGHSIDYDSGYQSDSNYHWYLCSECGEKVDDTYKAHQLGNPIYTGDDDGSFYQICSVCGYQTEISIHEHAWVATGGTAATCTVDGEAIFECSICGAKKTEPITATGHTEGIVTYTDNNDGTTHTKEIICSVCGETMSTEVESHVTGTNSKTTDCTVTTTTSCIYCDYASSVSETVHSGGEITTYTDKGDGTHTVTTKCATCGEVLDTKVENHETETITETNSCVTVTKDSCIYCDYATIISEEGEHAGLTTTYEQIEGDNKYHIVSSYCSDCGETFESYTEDHTFFVEYDEEGNSYFTCNDCGYSYLHDGSFYKDSWETIAERSSNGEAREYYAIGETRDITLTDGEDYEETITVRIVDFNHDELDPDSETYDESYNDGVYAGITIEMVDCLETKSTRSSRGNYKYSATPLRAKLISGGSIYETVPEELQSVIQEVFKYSVDKGKSSASISTSTDTLFILSTAEVGGGAISTSYYGGSVYSYYEKYSSAADRIKTVSGTASTWWLRDRYNTGSYNYAYSVGSGGGINTNSSDGGNGSYAQYGVSFAFCI